MPERPNILLITTDTSRWDTLRCMGNRYVMSPYLDRLAKEGVLFTQAHCCSPVCSPTRCSLLTGTHAPIHGVIENGIERREHLQVFPKLLAQAGYHNIMVGKTHFGPIPDSFHVQHILHGEKSQDSDDFYARYIRDQGYPRATAHPNPVPEDLFVDAYTVDTTIREIDAAVTADRKPFFAFCSLLSPHGPVDPPGPWAELYRDRLLPPINYRPGKVPEHPVHERRLVGLLDDERFPWPERERYFPQGRPDMQVIDEHRRLYYGLAAYCDAQIGRLIGHLDAEGLRENTLVIFTSGHGITLFDHGFYDKHCFYDSVWRVPLIMSMPGTLPAGVERDFAIWTDITATVLAVAGAEMPTVQGFDLFRPLTAGEASPRRCAVASLYKSCALATQSWKLEYYFEETTGRLFDFIADPEEQQDRYTDADYQPVRDALLQALLTWRADQMDLQDLMQRTTAGPSSGGPAARRIARYTHGLRGVDAELRLNERAEVADAMEISARTG